MKSNDVSIFASLNTTTVPVYDAAIVSQINGRAIVKSGPKEILLGSGDLPKQLSLDAEQQFTIYVTTSEPPVEYPPILMKWNEGFEMVAYEGWNSSNEEESILELSERSGKQFDISVVLEPKMQEIGIVLVGTGELPVHGKE